MRKFTATLTLKKMKTVSVLHLNATKEVSDVFIKCVAKNSLGQTESKSIKILVEHEPEIDLTIDKNVIYEGDTVRLNCKTNSYPAVTDYEWTLGGVVLREAKSAKELVFPVDKKLDTKEIMCTARNKVGVSSSSIILDIKCRLTCCANPHSSIKFDFSCRFPHIYPNSCGFQWQ